MLIDSYLKSHDFLLYIDEALRKNACQAVEKFLEDNAPIDNVQLHSIPSVIQSGGLNQLKKLTENQIKKTTKAKNRKFWEFVFEIIFADPGSDFSLRYIIKNHPRIREYLNDEESVSEKKEQKKIRKENKMLTDRVINYVLPVYFEHFNCHYFYKAGRGAGHE